MRNKILLSVFLTLLILGVQGKFAHVIANPSVDFSYSGVCYGSKTSFFVDNAVTNVSNVAIWHWNFGDGTFSNSQNPEHNFAGPGTYTVTLTITDIFLQTGSVSHNVDIQKLPVPFFSYSTPGCSNNSVFFTDLSTTPDGYIQKWKWNFGDGSPDVNVVFPDAPHRSHVFPNPGTFNVSLTVTNSVNACENKISIPISILPRPTANFYFNGKCEDQGIAFTDASVANGAGNIVDWSWDFGDPTSGIQNVSNLKNPRHIFENTGNYTVRLIVKNYNNCTDTIEKQVIVNPGPDVEFLHTPVCLKEAVTFTPDPVLVNLSSVVSWNWDFGDGITSNASNPDHAFMVSGNHPVTLTITDKLGCKNNITHVVVADPLPLAQFSSALSVCAGSEVNFLNQSSATVGYIDQWQWDFGDGTSVVVNHPSNPDVTHRYNLPITYNATLTVTGSNGCSNSSTRLITIKPLPIANFTSDIACMGLPAMFTDHTQLNGTGSIASWQWNFGDPVSGTENTSALQNPVHKFIKAGSPVVQLIVKGGNGCFDTVAYPVPVNPPPPVNFTAVNACQNSPVTFSPDPGIMNISSVASWFWEFGTGDNSVLRNPVYSFAQAGTYSVKLTITDNNGCTNSISKSVTISPEPVAGLSIPGSICIQTAVKFDNMSSVPGGLVVISEWDFGDGNIQTINSLASVFHSYANSGTYIVKLTVTSNDGCTKSTSQPLVILPQPLANFSFPNACMGSPVQFNDLSQAGIGSITEWSWNFGDPVSGAGNNASAKFPSHTYNTSGTYPVTLMVKNSGGCTDTIKKTVPVRGLPAVDFTFIPACVNEPTHFECSSMINQGAVSTCFWNFGDGLTSNSFDPDHAFTTNGTYLVSLTITDTAGCSSTKTRSVTIADPPVAVFNISAQNCTGSPVFFSVMLSVSGSNIDSWHWDFGDGTSAVFNAPANGNTSHSYAVSGTYKVVLIVKTAMGCESRSQKTFTVSPSPVALFISDNSCSGASVNFTNLSTPNSGPALQSWSWNFGDPASFAHNTSDQQHPNHIFSTPGTYTVDMQVVNTSGCSATVSKSIEIKPKPTVDFDWTGICMGSSTGFKTNTSVTNVASVVSYEWNFGDGSPKSSLSNPVHTYNITGNFTVTLTIVNTSGCTNSVSHLVGILPQPVALFSSSNSCIGSETQFVDQSSTSNGSPVVSWQWDFGESSVTNDSSNSKNPLWTYKKPGTYQAKLTVTSLTGCRNSVILPAQVFGNPVANFTYSASPCGNGEVFFKDSSYNKQAPVTEYKWEFEANKFSNDQNPRHVFYGIDTCYDVRLVVKDLRGCVGTVVKKACVPPMFDFSFVASNTCLNDSTRFSPQSLGAASGTLVSFAWNFGDPASNASNTSTKKTPSHFYSLPGTYTISLKATDLNNCSKTVYRDITILPLPVPYFTYREGMCDSTIYFNESSYSIGSEISRWNWDFGDGIQNSVSDVAFADATHQYLAAGAYRVGLTVVNAAGCSASTTVSDIIIKPCITAAFALVDTMVCQNNTLSFVDNSYSGSKTNEWFWDFGDGTRIRYTNYTDRVTHVFKSAGTFRVKLSISTTIAGRKISDTARINVVVNATPLPDFIFGVVCHEQNAVFTNMTSGNGTKISSYEWNFGEPFSDFQNISTMKNPVHLYKAPGTYDVKLKVKNMLGCTDSIQKSLIVYGLPDANYKYSVSCAGNTTVFTDLSVAAVAPIVDWDWTFYDERGVVGKADSKNPGFIYKTPGNYLVNLKVSDEYGCYDTINQQVTTWNVPKSKFAVINNYENVQGRIQLENNSVDASKYLWDFGDGNGSYAENPVAVYKNEGSYEISLVAWSDKNCSDTMKAKYEFLVKSLYIPNAFSPNNNKAEVQLLKPVGINLVRYRFEVFDRWGNLIWKTDKLDAEGRPVEGWDGKYKGMLMPEGVYPWRAFGVFSDGSMWESENVGTNDNLPKYKVGTATMIQ